MTIYAVIDRSSPPNPELKKAVEEQFSDNYIQLSNDTWLIAAKSTPKEIGGRLGTTPDKKIAAVILEVSSYFGWTSVDVWSWIKNKWEATSNG